MYILAVGERVLGDSELDALNNSHLGCDLRVAIEKDLKFTGLIVLQVINGIKKKPSASYDEKLIFFFYLCAVTVWFGLSEPHS